MKAMIKFDLPEEQEEFNQCCKSLDLCLSIFEIQQKLNQYIKCDDSLTDDQYDILCKFRDDVDEILYSYNIDIDNLCS